ncbi:MAG: tRNA dihydrouridine synthase DusB [Clostridia bacterium]|nr:tRNA dihydrouridine synthase DusB [Clostridia bacterium]
MRIGDIPLRHGLMLAPLAGVSDHPFRAICRRFGAEYTVSEMVSAQSLCYERMSKKASVGEHSRTAPLACVHKDDVPMAVQLFGRDPVFLSEAAKMIEDGSYAGCRSQAAPAAIDLNMGCPVPKIVGNGEGSALLKNPTLAGALVRAVKAAVRIPVTVKIRIGWDDDSVNAVEMAKILEDSGADAICVHGRTRTQMYRPGVNLEQIAAVKAAVRIPVIGNGDIYTAADALHMKKVTGCDGWMIARGAMGNPWLFSELRAALNGTPYIPPTLTERLTLAREHMTRMMEEKGEKVGFAESKKQVAWYIHGISGAAAARGKLMSATTTEEALQILNALTENSRP